MMSGCAHRVHIVAQPDVAAVTQQNVVTRTHIQHTREHIDKSVTEETAVSDDLKGIQSDISKLLK